MKYSLAGASLIAAVLSGCATPGLNQRIDTDTRTAEGLLKTQADKVDATTQLGGMVSIKKGLYLDDSQSTRRPARIPALESKVEINRSFSGLQGVADRITQVTGIAVRLAPEIQDAADPAPAQAAALVVSAASPLPGPGNAMVATGSYNVNFSGPLNQLLDDVAAHYHAAWDYDGRQIRFYKLETRSFDISALPFQDSVNLNIDLTPVTTSTDNSSGSSDSSSGSSGTSSSSGSSGSSSNSSSSSGSGTTDSTTGATAKMDINKELMDTVKLMLTASGKASVSPSTSELTVTDTPEALDRVGKLIGALNNKLTRQAMFNVRIYSVETDRTDDMSLSLSHIFSTKGLISTFASTPYSIGNAGSPLLKIASKGEASNNLIFDALSTEGKTTLVTSATVVAMNNKPVPITVAHLIPYVSSMTSQISQGDSNTVILPQLQTAYANSGLTMQLMPSISNHRDLLLHMALNMSRVESIKTFTSKALTTGNDDDGKGKKKDDNDASNLPESVSIPELSQRQLLQEVRLHSGETLLLTGLDQQNDSANASGVGTPGLPLPNGGHQDSASRDVLVISITPVVM